VKIASWARRGPVERRGDRHQLALVDGHQLGLTTASDNRHHAVANREALSGRPKRDDLAGDLHAGDVLRGAGGRRIETTSLHHVRAVQPRRAYAHEHLAGARRRVGVLLDHDLLVANGGGAHLAKPTRSQNYARAGRGPSRSRTQ
jgi:hypothetical protein